MLTDRTHLWVYLATLPTAPLLKKSGGQHPDPGDTVAAG